jgi:hypothetical protein
MRIEYSELLLPKNTLELGTTALQHASNHKMANQIIVWEIFCCKYIALPTFTYTPLYHAASATARHYTFDTGILSFLPISSTSIAVIDVYNV